MLALSLQHIDHTVDCAECACAATASAAMYDDRPFALAGCLFRTSAVRPSFVSADDGAAVLNQSQNMCGMSWGAKIRPAGVLKLCDFAKRLKWMVGVGEGKLANDDVGCVGVYGSWRLRRGVLACIICGAAPSHAWSAIFRA